MNTAVDMALGREVQHRIDLRTAQHTLDLGPVADVDLLEPVPWIPFEVGQVFQIPAYVSLSTLITVTPDARSAPYG